MTGVESLEFKGFPNMVILGRESSLKMTFNSSLGLVICPDYVKLCQLQYFVDYICCNHPAGKKHIHANVFANSSV